VQPYLQWKSYEYNTNCVWNCIQYAMITRQIVIRGVARYKIFYHIISQKVRF